FLNEFQDGPFKNCHCHLSLLAPESPSSPELLLSHKSHLGHSPAPHPEIRPDLVPEDLAPLADKLAIESHPAFKKAKVKDKLGEVLRGTLDDWFRWRPGCVKVQLDAEHRSPVDFPGVRSLAETGPPRVPFRAPVL